ncbi:MAG: hydantoinase B/oxoprolinase family protein [Candidatus Bipolaricaulaceae bacterium]
MDHIALGVMRHALAGVAEEMSTALVRTAYSPNIKERRDCSCALFDPQGQLVAQAENIPVHLGAMPFSVRAAMDAVSAWSPGDVVVLNDPFRGGAHLPDITFVAPAFAGGELVGFAAARAHHADVGGMTPGSLPAAAAEIYQEGLVLPPVLLWRRGELVGDLLSVILANVRTPREREGDLRAQRAAVETGIRRLLALVQRFGREVVLSAYQALMDYAELRMRAAVRAAPAGQYTFTDVLDEGVEISVRVDIEADEVTVDFAGSSPQVNLPVNAPLAVTASAVYFALRAVLDPDVPANAGAWRPVHILAPPGTVTHARPPAAVGGGNLELSQRIVDVVLGALAQAMPDRVPAASQGTMNNLTVGGLDPRSGEPYTFYETIGGGYGARPNRDGVDGVHAHMTNTWNTPVEALEQAYPLRVERYELRPGSGGEGRFRGGLGICRQLRVVGHWARASLLADRRRGRPYGLAGGRPGAPGEDSLQGPSGVAPLPAKATVDVPPGGVITIRTPGGGGHGPPQRRAPELRERDVREGKVPAAAQPSAAPPNTDLR